MTSNFIPSIAEVNAMLPITIQEKFTAAAEYANTVETELMNVKANLEQASTAFTSMQEAEQKALAQIEHLEKRITVLTEALRAERLVSVATMVDEVLEEEADGKCDAEDLDLDDVRDHVLTFLRDAMRNGEEWITPEQTFIFETTWTVVGKITVRARNANAAERLAKRVEMDGVTWYEHAQGSEEMEVETDSCDHESTERVEQ